jgi:hypothetical protein
MMLGSLWIVEVISITSHDQIRCRHAGTNINEYPNGTPKAFVAPIRASKNDFDCDM